MTCIRGTSWSAWSPQPMHFFAQLHSCPAQCGGGYQVGVGWLLSFLQARMFMHASCLDCISLAASCLSSAAVDKVDLPLPALLFGYVSFTRHESYLPCSVAGHATPAAAIMSEASCYRRSKHNLACIFSTVTSAGTMLFVTNAHTA